MFQISLFLALFTNPITTQIINSLKQDYNGYILNDFFGKDAVLSALKEGNITLPSLSPECLASVFGLLQPFIGLTNKTEIIIKLFTLPLGKYIDSWPKPKRLLSGHLKWFGAYDECQRIHDAKYCISDMIFLKKYPGQLGVCIPKQCNKSDVFQLLKTAEQYSYESLQFSGNNIACDDEPWKYSTGCYITVLLCCLLLLLCFVGTLVHEYKPYFQRAMQYNELVNATSDREEIKHVEVTKESGLIRFFECFSIRKNLVLILSTNVPKGAVESLNGIRVLSMTWVILGHMYFEPFSAKRFDNPLLGIEVIHDFSWIAIASAFVAVDTFFMLSGFLVTYLSLRRMDSNNGKLPLWKFYLHRYIRLTPTYMFAILLWNYIYPLILTGPMSLHSHSQPSLCDKCAWTNFLYINNFYPHNMIDQCMGWSWYLANDMQFYIISPVILYIMYWFDQKSRAGVYILLASLTAFSMLLRGLLTGINNYPAIIAASFVGDPRTVSLNEFTSNVYERPYTRFGAYSIGMLLGYIISRGIKYQGRYKKLFYLTGWLLALTTGMAVVYGPWSVFRDGGEFFTNATNIIYATFHRVAWSCAVAWVVFACHNKYGGFINELISWRCWIPLSRLSFTAYLIHYFVLSYFYTVQENLVHYQTDIIAFNFVSVSVISYACAFVLSVSVEFPLLNLEKMLLN